MKYDTPFRKATLTECNDTTESFYHAISANEDDARLMSPAAYDVVGRAIASWIGMPGMVDCKLNIEAQTLEVGLAYPTESRYFDLAVFTLPFDELVRATAQTCQGWDGTPPSALSAMLRKLADEIDAGEQEA